MNYTNNLNCTLGVVYARIKCNGRIEEALMIGHWVQSCILNRQVNRMSM
ncbi:MAG: hypothetical protein RIR96_269 [Bacteroidota bacterium]